MFMEDSEGISLPKVNAKARLDKDFHREVSHALVDRGVTLDQAITRGLELWLELEKAGGSTSGKEIPVGVLTDTGVGRNNESTTRGQGKPEDWRIEMAIDVLNSDHPVAGIALTANIISFHLLIKQQESSDVADPATTERIRLAREQNERITAAIKRLRAKPARFNEAM
jgi:hypothetical protein